VFLCEKEGPGGRRKGWFSSLFFLLKKHPALASAFIWKKNIRVG